MGFFRRKKQIEAVPLPVELPEPAAPAEDKNELIAAISAAVYLYLELEKAQSAVPAWPPAPFFLRARKR
ncbi:MAG: hypothetical protein FWD58_04450 [Firmicutes bacterium]|nr:hypothetical protein [Bacillota bacterium]